VSSSRSSGCNWRELECQSCAKRRRATICEPRCERVRRGTAATIIINAQSAKCGQSLERYERVAHRDRTIDRVAELEVVVDTKGARNRIATWNACQRYFRVYKDAACLIFGTSDHRNTGSASSMGVVSAVQPQRDQAMWRPGERGCLCRQVI
jgi:hypothetical protein